jgi:membrane-bound metal-dependent hydrolase YbcI (DUF457 family)
MFIGHFALGFGAKSVAPKVSLGSLLLAAQFIDLLWPTLLLLGVERVRIAPGATAVTPLLFESYPISHSLFAVIAWAILVSGVYLLGRKEARGALIIALLVISHWLLDALVHRPDLPLYPGSGTLIGLNLWSSLPLTLAIEVPLFALGVWLYLRATQARDATGKWALWSLVAFLTVVYFVNLFGEPPPSVTAIGWLGQLQWLLVVWGYWIDRHRAPA